ncbi:MAG: DUF1284 domain-containing protein [Blautia sp.]|nr:DUF1284 domain-containing protein [Blautia sp.]MDY5032341.1 DUF1284 domain-containing protein [Blautia sp.]
MSRYKGCTPLRPHHLMCLAFFKGNGYSDGFSAHMQEMLEHFQKNPRVRLVLQGDEICSACPNQRGGKDCVSADSVRKYDTAVLEACRLKEEEERNFMELAALVQREIMDPEKREAICRDCQWNELCRNTPSRWENIPPGEQAHLRSYP